MCHSIVVYSLFLSFLLSSFLVLNTLNWRLAARGILYNSNIRNSCGLFDIHGTSIGNTFSFFIFPDSVFEGWRRVH